MTGGTTDVRQVKKQGTQVEAKLVYGVHGHFSACGLEVCSPLVPRLGGTTKCILLSSFKVGSSNVLVRKDHMSENSGRIDGNDGSGGNRRYTVDINQPLHIHTTYVVYYILSRNAKCSLSGDHTIIQSELQNL